MAKEQELEDKCRAKEDMRHTVHQLEEAQHALQVCSNAVVGVGVITHFITCRNCNGPWRLLHISGRGAL